MIVPTFRVGVVVEKRPSKSPWAEWSWHIVAVVPEAPGTAAGAVLGGEGDAQMIYAGSSEVEFHRVETANYRDNLVSGRPALWVTLQTDDEAPAGIRLLSVTADPAEGEAMTEAGELLVDTVAMPSDMAEALAAFIETHHVERAFTKRKRI